MTIIAEQMTKTRLDVSFLWLELTGRCGLRCTHCYAGSGTEGTHGSMTSDDWQSVITSAGELGIGMVQFIGEPTLHPQFAELLAYAIGAGLAVEVYSNLTHVKDAWWDLLARPNVCLATSYYSDLAAEHDAITGRSGSHARTLANIRHAVALQIPVRAGIVAVHGGQRTGQARAELESIGVTRVRTDKVRALGRAASLGVPDVSQLCGKCRSRDCCDPSLGRCVPVRHVEVADRGQRPADSAGGHPGRPGHGRSYRRHPGQIRHSLRP
jgi:pyruvate-formate lyase-activating enzyme